ncbi:MAG: hypothetical protein H7A01_18485 [Hahellaceae bacterium]|jgi:hypothetical protein|nr:hypothetical protein [Hahellaceae bacterium]MCP5213078.1 hypothetical protein [Hahellaceae bacterium]
MSKLSHLIAQAKNSRKINDMFKTETLIFSPEKPSDEDPLDAQLSALIELLSTSTPSAKACQEVVFELEEIAECLK